MSPLAYAATFGAIIAARNLLEILAGQNPVYFADQFFVHYPLAYVAPMLALVLVLHLFSGTPIQRVTRLMLYVWALTLLPPLVDLMLGRGAEGIGYLRLGTHRPGEIFLRFFDPTLKLGGTTVGIRSETAAACLLGGAYVWMRRRGVAGLVLAAPTAACVYAIALGFFTLPRLVAAALSPLLPGQTAGSLFLPPQVVVIPPPLDVRVADHVAIAYLVPLCLLLGAVWLWRAAPAGFVALGRTLLQRLPGRPMVITAGGVWLGALARAQLGHTSLHPAPVDVLAAIALVFAAGLIDGGARFLLERDDHGAGPGRSVPPAGARRPVGVAMVGAGLALASVSGAAAASLLMVVLMMTWIARRPPLQLQDWWFGGPVVDGLIAVALLGTGAAWALRVDALAALPPALVQGLSLAVVLAGIGSHLVHQGAPLQPGSLPVPLSAARWMAPLTWAAAAAALPLLAGAGILAIGLCGALLTAAALPRLAGQPVAGIERVGRTLALALGLAFALGSPSSSPALVESGIERPKFVVRRAMALEATDDIDAAIVAYRHALKLDAEQPRVLARLGELHRKRGDMEAARAAFRQAIALDPLALAARQQLAALLLADGDAAGAVELLEAAAQIAPEHPVVALSLAEGLTALDGARTRAIAAWQHYLQVSRGNALEQPYQARARATLAALVAAE